MTPEEKAKELIENFDYQVCTDLGVTASDSSETSARQCAIMCSQEVVLALLKNSNTSLDYWQSVLNHLKQ